ncbi:hypothetical protein M8818_007294 [Zalaria obscura]|uniref:Uncharacterized protein n=1 Tax=Zalaria obscura TaxID=2024903 RepID=A0ACC3S6V8_9PEZI
MDRDVSPPALKRRRLGSDTVQTRREKESEIEEQPNPPSSMSEDLSIYSWNVNGIQPFTQRPITSFFKGRQDPKVHHNDTAGAEGPAPTASLRDFLRLRGWPTLLFLQEVKINPSDSATIRSVERSVRAPPGSAEPDYQAHFCLPSDKHNVRGFGGKVYGVCSIIRSDFLRSRVEQVRTVDWDAEGRFQIVETKPCKGIPKLSIWNIYAVNGTTNPYRDPTTGAIKGTRHDRKLAVHALLLSDCKRLEEDGYRVILAGDLNIARARIDGFPNLRTFPEQHQINRADFNAKFFDDPDGLRGIDTFRLLHRDKRGYTYYPRSRKFGESCDRVDLMICSRALKDNVKEANMLETPAFRGPSDHVPVYASFRFGESHHGNDQNRT